MTETRDRLVQWLRDAHAMEEQAHTMLKGQLKRVEHYPELEARVRDHIEETRGQSETVAQCLEQLGESPSGMKDTGSKLLALGQSISGVFADDEVMNWALASHAFENLEVASYTVLVATAEAAGEEGIAEACRGILKQEEAMASWVKDNLRPLTVKYLTRDSADLPASR
ncbi:ferritin-like domain-containing protein [Glycocaulis profundi]|nr:ferritin-like domain-containing protein [Glycocaulis profundi]